MLFIVIMDEPKWFTSLAHKNNLFIGRGLNNNDKLEVIGKWLEQLDTLDTQLTGSEKNR